jgi:hypothetical protein
MTMPIYHQVPNSKKKITLIGMGKERKTPPGCIDVYQVQSAFHRRPGYHGIFREHSHALDRAIHLAQTELSHNDVAITVAHKAAIELPDGSFHLVHFNAIRFMLPTEVNSSHSSLDSNT